MDSSDESSDDENFENNEENTELQSTMVAYDAVRVDDSDDMVSLIMEYSRLTMRDNSTIIAPLHGHSDSDSPSPNNNTYDPLQSFNISIDENRTRATYVELLQTYEIVYQLNVRLGKTLDTEIYTNKENLRSMEERMVVKEKEVSTLKENLKNMEQMCHEEINLNKEVTAFGVRERKELNEKVRNLEIELFMAKGMARTSELKKKEMSEHKVEWEKVIQELVEEMTMKDEELERVKDELRTVKKKEMSEHKVELEKVIQEMVEENTLKDEELDRVKDELRTVKDGGKVNIIENKKNDELKRMEEELARKDEELNDLEMDNIALMEEIQKREHNRDNIIELRTTLEQQSALINELKSEIQSSGINRILMETEIKTNNEKINNLESNLSHSRDENIKLKNEMKALRNNRTDEQAVNSATTHVEGALYTSATRDERSTPGKRAMLITTSMARDINQTSFNETYEHGTATFHRFHGGKVLDIRKKMEAKVQTEKPDLVVFQAGGNDLQDNISPIALAHNIIGAGKQFRKSGATVAISSVLPRAKMELNSKRWEVNILLQGLCAANNLRFIDNSKITVSNHILRKDGVHLNEAGTFLFSANLVNCLNSLSV